MIIKRIRYWYAAQARPLIEVEALALKYDCRVVAAGDIFDRWNSPPELLYFAIEHLDGWVCIPGQHDLPNHEYAARNRSAYGVLSRCGKILDIPGDNSPTQIARDVYMHAFPWDHPVVPLPQREPGAKIHIAVVHAYIWATGSGSPGATLPGNLAPAWEDRLAGYDAAVFGDNHKGFRYKNIWNNGTLMCRKSDERDYRPRVGLLHDDGHIEAHYLDTSQDKWVDDLESARTAEHILDSTEFIDGLRGLGNDSLDFRDYVRRYVLERGIAGRTRDLVEAALEGT